MAEEEYQVALRLLREVFNLGGHAEALEGKIKSLSCELAEAREKLASLEKTFQHTHEAHYVVGGLLDSCGQCGLDIRDSIHRRYLPAPAADGEKPKKEYDCLQVDPSAEQPCGECGPCLRSKGEKPGAKL